MSSLELSQSCVSGPRWDGRTGGRQGRWLLWWMFVSIQYATKLRGAALVCSPKEFHPVNYAKLHKTLITSHDSALCGAAGENADYQAQAHRLSRDGQTGQIWHVKTQSSIGIDATSSQVKLVRLTPGAIAYLL